MKRRGWIILAAVAAACLLFFGFVVYKVATMPPMFPPYNFASGFENPKEFQKEVGMRVGCKLPPSVRRVHFWHDGGKDPTEWIAFTVDAGDLPAIKAQIDSGPWTTAMPELPRRIPDDFKWWWHPSSTNISVKLTEMGPYKGAGGALWVIDYSTATVYFCGYSS